MKLNKLLPVKHTWAPWRWWRLWSHILRVLHIAAHLLGHLADTLDTGAVQVTVVLARLDKPMALDVLLHLFPRRHKVIVPPIHLILSLGPCGVCQPSNKWIQHKYKNKASTHTTITRHYSPSPLSLPSLRDTHPADNTVTWLQVAAAASNKNLGGNSSAPTGSVITYVGHMIRTYQGTQTAGRHLSCPSQGPGWWWASHNELERKERRRLWAKKKKI